MIRAIQLILFPFREWEKIVAANRGIAATLFLSLLPLIVIASAIEGYSLAQFGLKRGEFGHVVTIPTAVAIQFEISQGVLNLATIFLSAWLLRAIALSFQVHPSYTQCFTAAAYGYSPIFLAQMLDAVPVINTWVCWAIGAALSMSVLYHGVALALKPDQTKGFGMYMLTAMLIIVFSGLVHLLSVFLLTGNLLR
ncbi:MAG: YIP1 family protein [Verrucomicrobiota bacterium]|jgi:hypothetical protein